MRHRKKKIDRRSFVKGSAALAAASSLGACDYFGDGKKRELRWLGWEHYDVRELREEFEETYNCKVRAQYFDGNSEAWAKLKAGGDRNFHLVMADGFWPRQYFGDGYIQKIDTDKLQNADLLFDDFKPAQYPFITNEAMPSELIAVPNCWGGYGMTVNKNKVKDLKQNSLKLLFEAPELAGRVTTSARFEENIALAGILAANELGTINNRHHDGMFNPYNLKSKELVLVEELLKEQQKLLLTRWNDEDTLERLLREEEVWVSPEWSGIHRRLRFEFIDGKSSVDTTHILKPKEGGLGWVDTWCMTNAAFENVEVENLAYKWIDFRLQKSSMTKIATDVGWAPCVDIRDELKAARNGNLLIETLFLDRTSDISSLYQFDKPSNTAKWEQIWSNVLAS